MLVKINSQEAFGLLINKDKCEYVFFKHNGNYEKAAGYRWIFGGGNGGIDFAKAEFYKEVEETNN